VVSNSGSFSGSLSLSLRSLPQSASASVVPCRSLLWFSYALVSSGGSQLLYCRLPYSVGHRSDSSTPTNPENSTASSRVDRLPVSRSRQLIPYQQPCSLRLLLVHSGLPRSTEVLQYVNFFLEIDSLAALLLSSLNIQASLFLPS
jgi:hypothetical protein